MKKTALTHMKTEVPKSCCKEKILKVDRGGKYRFFLYIQKSKDKNYSRFLVRCKWNNILRVLKRKNS